MHAPSKRGVMKIITLSILLSAGFLWGCMEASASLSTYFGEDVGSTVRFDQSRLAESDFLSALDSSGSEDFETFEVGYSKSPLNLTFVGSSIEATLSTAEWWNSSVRESGTRHYLSGTDLGIAFSEPINAFGAYAMDLGDEGGRLLLEFVHADQTVSTWATPTTLNYVGRGASYFGVISDKPFTRVNMRNSNRYYEIYTLDKLTAGHATIPEPSSALLWGLGMAGFMGWRRFRSSF